MVLWMLLAACLSDYSLISVPPPVQAPAQTQAPTPAPAKRETVIVDPAATARLTARPGEEVVRQRRQQDLATVLGDLGLPRMVAEVPDPTTSSATEAWADPTGAVRREVFAAGRGSRTPVSDFLFVIDNSASMRHIIDQVTAAFDTLQQEEVFPAGARLAVMTTMPGDLRDPHLLHPGIRLQRASWEPGFLKLVDREGILTWRQAWPDRADQFPFVGCTPWFAPNARGADNVPCLRAHTRMTTSVSVEAGLTAVGQLLDLQGDHPLFRPGAAVNVIIVSNTHDPGIGASTEWFKELTEARPSALALRMKVEETQQVASFRIHGIVPASNCGETWTHIGPSYVQASQESGGQLTDVCTTTDYAAFIRRLAQEGAVATEPVIALGAPTSDHAVVRTDGLPVEWRASFDRRSIRVAMSAPAEVEITYLRQDAAGWYGKRLRDP